MSFVVTAPVDGLIVVALETADAGADVGAAAVAGIIDGVASVAAADDDSDVIEVSPTG